jgi:DNA-directed RNA polymerase subunit D
MNIRVLEKKDSEISILFEDAPLPILSGLRRIAMEEVPTMAIDSVLILENNSVLHDEVLAHRMALVPLTSEKALEKYRPPEECIECTNCENCYTRLYLEASNNEEEWKIVYSGEMRSEDPDVKPVYDNIPLVMLGKDQRIVLEAEARLGRGKEHIKYSPVSISTLLAVPKIIFDTTQASDEDLSECLSCIENYSKKLVELIREKGKGETEFLEKRNTSLLKYCEEKKCKDILKLLYLPNKRVLTIESTGSLKPETIILYSFKILKEKLARIEKYMEEIGGKH